jgi:hypothetical protein
MGSSTEYLVFNFWNRQEISLFSKILILVQGPTHLPVQWISGGLPQGNRARACVVVNVLVPLTFLKFCGTHFVGGTSDYSI